jgi:hypothetical protein
LNNLAGDWIGSFPHFALLCYMSNDGTLAMMKELQVAVSLLKLLQANSGLAFQVLTFYWKNFSTVMLELDVGINYYGWLFCYEY